MLFPKTVFVEQWTVNEQMEKIGTEFGEVIDALANPTIDKEGVAIKLWDLIQSTETALRILEEQHGVDVTTVRQYVYDKNRARGYYL
jgi:hypothetical protein